MTKKEKEKLNSERLELIAKKYSAGLSIGEEIRLKELQSLINKLYPSVTKKMWKALKKIMDDQKDRDAKAERYLEYVDKFLEACKKNDETGSKDDKRRKKS